MEKILKFFKGLQRCYLFFESKVKRFYVSLIIGYKWQIIFVECLEIIKVS